MHLQPSLGLWQIQSQGLCIFKVENTFQEKRQLQKGSWISFGSSSTKNLLHLILKQMNSPKNDY